MAGVTPTDDGRGRRHSYGCLEAILKQMDDFVEGGSKDVDSLVVEESDHGGKTHDKCLDRQALGEPAGVTSLFYPTRETGSTVRAWVSLLNLMGITDRH